MAEIIGFQSLGQTGLPAIAAGLHVALHDSEGTSTGTPTEVVLLAGNGVSFTLTGNGLTYAPDGELLGGQVTGITEANAQGTVFVGTGFDLSAAAMLGFIADHRLDQFSEYIFRTDDVFDASDFPDLIAGFAGSDVLAGNGGADTIHGVTGDDTIDAGDGSDYALGERGNDSIGGGAGNDLLLGNLGLDTISGGDGNDTIFGGKEYDVLDGGTGDDLVYGDLGGDDLHDGPGNDTLVAGGGTGDVDWFYFASGSGQDRVEQFDIGDGDLLRIQTRINNTTIVDFASLVDRITSDGHGDSIIDLGGANYIRLVGVDRADIDASWFAFDDPPGPSLLGGAAA